MSMKPGTQPKRYDLPLEVMQRDKYYALLYERRNEGKDYKEYIRI